MYKLMAAITTLAMIGVVATVFDVASDLTGGQNSVLFMVVQTIAIALAVGLLVLLGAVLMFKERKPRKLADDNPSMAWVLEVLQQIGALQFTESKIAIRIEMMLKHISELAANEKNEKRLKALREAESRMVVVCWKHALHRLKKLYQSQWLYTEAWGLYRDLQEIEGYLRSVLQKCDRLEKSDDESESYAVRELSQIVKEKLNYVEHYWFGEVPVKIE